jgi:hypothetical protein
MENHFFLSSKEFAKRECGEALKEAQDHLGYNQSKHSSFIYVGEVYEMYLTVAFLSKGEWIVQEFVFYT